MADFLALPKTYVIYGTYVYTKTVSKYVEKQGLFRTHKQKVKDEETKVARKKILLNSDKFTWVNKDYIRRLDVQIFDLEYSIDLNKVNHIMGFDDPPIKTFYLDADATKKLKEIYLLTMHLDQYYYRVYLWYPNFYEMFDYIEENLGKTYSDE